VTRIDLERAIARAVALWRDDVSWRCRCAMSIDVGWTGPASHAALFRELVAASPG
jgi:hypothetical protein